MIVVDPQDVPWLTFDWSEFLPAGVTLGEVEHAVPAPLQRESQATDAGAKSSRLKVSGFVHGGLYVIEARSTLSNGETFERSMTVQAFNGAG